SVEILHGTRLGDLDIEGAGGNAAPFDRSGYVGHELGLLELSRRDVDGNAEPGMPEIVPLADLMATGIQDPPSDRHDEPGHLSQGDEFVRRKEAELGVGPADQS